MPAQPEIIPVLLAGGEGRRLWPLSTPSRPKPFLRLPCGRSLLQATAQRVSHFGSPLMVCQSRHELLVRSHLTEGSIKARALLLEPESRNTAPAIAAAAQFLSSDGDDPLLLILPTDHAIRKPSALLQAIHEGVTVASQGQIVLIGILPTRAANDFGYIRRSGIPDSTARPVDCFVEKPDRQKAAGFLKEGRWLWNSGMFLGRASSFLKAFEHSAPHITAASSLALEKSEKSNDRVLLCHQSYRNAPNISIDRAIIEKSPDLSAVSADLGWRDLGTWRSYLTYWLEASVLSA